MSELKTLHERIRECTGCKLKGGRTNAVPGEKAEKIAVAPMATGAPAESTYAENQFYSPPSQRAHKSGRRDWLLVALAVAVGAIIVVGAILGAMLLRWSGDSLEDMLAEAQTALADRRDDEAIELFKEVLEEDADNVEALKGTGEAYEAQEDWPRAVVWYERWMQVAPDNTDALSAVGWAAYELEDYENAEAYFKRADRLAPDHLTSDLGLGRVYLAIGDFASSLENAKWALEMAPDGSDEQEQAVQLLQDLSETDSGVEPSLVLSQWHADQGDDAAFQQANLQIVKRIPHPMDVNLGDTVRFLGYELRDLPDGQIQVDLYFQAISGMDLDYKVWLHAHVNDEDIALLPPERQQYGFDNWGHPMSYPTSQWSEGAVYRDRTVRPAAPGEYRFVFGVWLPDSDIRLPTSDDPVGAVDIGWQLVNAKAVNADVLSSYGWKKLEDDELEQARLAAEIALEREPDNLDALLVASAVYAALGDNDKLGEVTNRLLRLVPNGKSVLLGDTMQFIGYDIQPLVDGQIQVDLYFQTIAGMDSDYAVWLHAHVNEEDIPVLPPERQQYGFDNWGHPMSHPTSRWVEGAVYRDRTVRQVQPAAYRFRFGVWLPETEAHLATSGDPKGTVDIGWYSVGGK